LYPNTEVPKHENTQKNAMQKLFIHIILCLLPIAGAAQTTLQVVTKTVQKTVGWKPGYELEINGEKAEVEVTPGSGNNIVVRAELSARHPMLDTAKIDVEGWKFVVSTIGKKVYVRAYVGLPSGKRLPTSNLKAKIVIQAPPSCPVNLANKFGKAHLERLDAPIVLSGEFCSFTLLQLKGSVRVDSRYGNIEGTAIQGKVDVQSKRADVALSQIHADCAVRSEYGKVWVQPDAQTGNVWIQGTKSDVTVDLPQPPQHNVFLTAEYGNVSVPAAFQQSKSGENTNRAVLNQQGTRPVLTVETNFGSITVQ
jgi:hypothetical protein